MSNAEVIAASDLERYGYCPLSWWLGRDHQVQSPKLASGSREHSELSEELEDIRSKERDRTDLRLSFIISVAMIVNLLAVISVGFMDAPSEHKVAWLFTTSIGWILIGGGLLLIHYRKRRWGTYTFIEGGIMALSTLMMIIALNTIILLQINYIDGSSYLFLALMWLIIIIAIQILHHSLNGELLGILSRSGIDGDVVYIGEEGETLRSDTLGLSGKPDLILRRRDELIPVEIKTGRVPRGPLFSHILQLGAYCVILSDIEEQRVEKGYIRYGQKDFEIDFDANLEELVLLKAEEMRRLMKDGGAHRNHNREAKCRNCSRRQLCPETLV